MLISVFNNREKRIKKAKLAVLAIGYIIPDDQSKIMIVGSAFVISKNKNRVAGCYHIINPDPPTSFAITNVPNLRALVPIKADGSLYEWRPLKLIDKDKENDVAIYEVDTLANSIVEELKLGNSDNVKEGAKVCFIGYPYAAVIMNEGWGWTEVLNTGVVSTIKFNQDQKRVFILVDAINNPGNSGCPLMFERNNVVVGVMTNAFRKPTELEKYKDLDIREPMHVGGARPINAVRQLLDNLSHKLLTETGQQTSRIDPK
ncbi:MAG: serine protease [Candidatus Parcubacteria bacterium]|nr:serine protease [Candidatus Parcubacteria bacterium]